MTVSIETELNKTRAELCLNKEAMLDMEQRTNQLEVRLRHSDSLIDDKDTELFRYRSDKKNLEMSQSLSPDSGKKHRSNRRHSEVI